MWFVGDVANLIGGAWAGLVPVVIAIAVYFCIADSVMITQVLYYKARSARLNARRHSSIDAPDPTTPLLGRHPSDPRTNFSDVAPASNDAEAGLAKVVDEGQGRNAWLKNIFSVLGIFFVGTAGWTIAWQTGTWKPAPIEQDGDGQMVLGAQILGYFSAVCYLGYAMLPACSSYKC